LAKEFQEKASMMSEDAREKEQKRLVKMERDFKIKAQEYEEDFKVSMQKATEKLSKEVDDAVYQYARSNKIDVVVDKWTGRVIYSSQENEPTGEIVALMNQSHEKRVALENTKKSAASTTVAATKTENKANKA
jgi:Skp family chaperone for outer membrane proteins